MTATKANGTNGKGDLPALHARVSQTTPAYELQKDPFADQSWGSSTSPQAQMVQSPQMASPPTRTLSPSELSPEETGNGLGIVGTGTHEYGGASSRRNPNMSYIDTRAAQESLGSTGPRRLGTHDSYSSTKRPTSPHITVATPTSARHHALSHQLQAQQHERASSLPVQAGAAQVTSPVRQNSLSRMATEAAQSVVDAMTTGRTTPSTGSSGRPGSANAINRKRSENVGGVQEVPPHVYGSPTTAFLDGDAVADAYDDEEGKGHGLNRSNSGHTSGRWTPTIISSIMKKAEGRFSPASPFASPHIAANHAAFPQSHAHYQKAVASPTKVPAGLPHDSNGIHEDEIKYAEKHRKTPTCYRPANDDVAQVGRFQADHSFAHTSSDPYAHHAKAHPLSHAHKISISSTSNSSHSINMNSPPLDLSHSRHTSHHSSTPHMSPISGTSRMTGTRAANPASLVVPQARRGAMNLRPLRRRKRSASARQRQKGPSLPLHVRIARFIRFLFTAILHPLGTCAYAKRSFCSTACSIDLAFRDPNTGARVWRPSWLGAYIPLLIWLAISLSSTFTVLIWHTEVFQALDRLSLYLQGMGFSGRLILGSLIFLTTFPPLPLYSTLIILCGFTFGLWQGFIISYIAALSGAITVFLLSRSLLKGWMLNLLNKSGGLKRVVRAIEKRPKLLFLVRLAPYPYNLMNTLLASSPTLTLKTYTMCTALALPKLLVHCGLGTTIKNFAAYNGAGQSSAGDTSDSFDSDTSSTIISGVSADDASASETAELIKHVFGFAGVGLCVGIFFYLFSVARRAVDEELDEDDEANDDYELVLSDEEDEEMRETSGELDRVAAPHSSSNEFVIGDHDDDSHDHNRTPGPNRTSWPLRDGDSAQKSAKNPFNGGVHLRSESTHRYETEDGTTPMYIVPPRLEYQPDGSYETGRSYFGWQAVQRGNGSKGRTSSNLSDSQTSLAESIAEMEKHATLLDGIAPHDEDSAAVNGNHTTEVASLPLSSDRRASPSPRRLASRQANEEATGKSLAQPHEASGDKHKAARNHSARNGPPSRSVAAR